MSYKGRKGRPPAKNAWEYDAFSKVYKRWLGWNAGVRKDIKRRFNKRARREGRRAKDER